MISLPDEPTAFRYIARQLSRSVGSTDIVAVLIADGWSRDDAESMVRDVVIQSERRIAQAKRDLMIGGPVLALGALVSGLGYVFAAPGQTYTVFFGALAYGAFRLIRGSFRYSPLFGAVALVLVALAASGAGLWVTKRNDQSPAIQSQNAAALQPNSSGSSPSSSSVFDLKVGDCFSSSGGLSGELSSIVIQDCSGTWSYRVVKLVPVSSPDSANYPGASYFSSLATNQCPLETDSVIYPTTQSWSQGDRTVTCVTKHP